MVLKLLTLFYRLGIESRFYIDLTKNKSLFTGCATSSAATTTANRQKALEYPQHFDYPLAKGGEYLLSDNRNFQARRHQLQEFVCYLRDLRWLHKGFGTVTQPHAVDSQDQDPPENDLQQAAA